MTSKSLYRTVAALALFGVSFGYLEASVVVYLRAIYDPIRQRLHPGRRPGELFPLITPDQLDQAGPEHTQRLAIELGREAATLAMVLAIALAAGGNFGERAAAFAIVFGIWDISFYAFLRLFIRWPESLSTWDLLFLIPVPWVGPVWAPILVSLSMIVCGLISLRLGGVRGRPLDLLGVLAGAVVIVAAFAWDYRNTMAGGMPNSFNWPLLFAGEALGITGFVGAVRSRGSREFRRPPGS